MVKTVDRLKKYPIKCFLYSNKLEKIIHKPDKYTSTLRLSEDTKKLIIMTKKYNEASKYRQDSNKAEKIKEEQK